MYLSVTAFLHLCKQHLEEATAMTTEDRCDTTHVLRQGGERTSGHPRLGTKYD